MERLGIRSRTGLRPVIWLAVVSVAAHFTAPAALAEVRSCVLDGGGTRERRLCGINRYVNHVRMVYGDSIPMRESLLTGDGNDPAADCRESHLFHVDGSGNRTRIRDPDLRHIDLNTSVEPANERSGVYGAQLSEIGRRCWAGAGSDDTCHFWSSNHGRYEGNLDGGASPDGAFIVLYDPSGGNERFRPRHFRNLMNGRGCGSYRFVLNNCHSSGMMEAILDPQSGRVIPDRCGSASTTYYETSKGAGVREPLRLNPPVTHNGREVRVGSPRYAYTEMFTYALARTLPHKRTLDDAHFETLKDGFVNEQPVLTSDHFLDRHFGGSVPEGERQHTEQYRIARALREQRECFGETPQDRSFTAVLSQSEELTSAASAAAGGAASILRMNAAGLPEARLAEVNDDISRMQRQVREYEEWFCNRFNDAIEESLGQSCREASGEARKRIMREYYRKEFRDKRAKLLNAYRSCVRKYEEYGSSAPHLEANCQAVGNRLNQLYSRQRYSRRYDFLLNRLGRALRFYQSADRQAVEDFLTLRRCETSDFHGPVRSRLPSEPPRAGEASS